MTELQRPGGAVQQRPRAISVLPVSGWRGRCGRVAGVVAVVCALCAGVLGVAAGSAAAAPGGSGYFVTFVARACPAYSDIFANRARNDILESLDDLGPDTQYGSSGRVINPIDEARPPQNPCKPLRARDAVRAREAPHDDRCLIGAHCFGRRRGRMEVVGG